MTVTDSFLMKVAGSHSADNKQTKDNITERHRAAMTNPASTASSAGEIKLLS